MAGTPCVIDGGRFGRGKHVRRSSIPRKLAHDYSCFVVWQQREFHSLLEEYSWPEVLPKRLETGEGVVMFGCSAEGARSGVKQGCPPPC